MNWHAFLEKWSEEPWFDIASLMQLTDEPREQVRMQVHRWCAAGKLVRLRRGLYTFGQVYRKKPVNPAVLANQLYTPSYLSLQWALHYHGLIPEAVFALTSITTRQTQRFDNPFGVFRYRHLKQHRFWGYQAVSFAHGTVHMATPEKALIDFWYMDRGAWTLDRMRAMRFQHFDGVDRAALRAAVKRFGSRKVEHALTCWERLHQQETEGTVTL